MPFVFTLKVFPPVGGGGWNSCTIIYGGTEIELLWKYLYDIAGSIRLPWMLIDGFCVIASLEGSVSAMGIFRVTLRSGEETAFCKNARVYPASWVLHIHGEKGSFGDVLPILS
ncbi:uncharacterized protein LOC131163721 [Malania oleifera]|uniref:uncharacterized protein LOC131163721 n=1 Tax=Malania oleifera TaxID=397392 RepID=UPI0025AEA0A2|nr:uncharacterized protein LOC131163721 [Malania oleifera]